MKRLGATAMVLFLDLVALAVGQQPAAQDDLPALPDGQTWKLVWNDEFNGTQLDQSKWIYRQEGQRRDGWWSRKAVSLDGEGHLVMSTLKENGKYIDACVATQGKFEHAFGYYAARIQLQKQPGHWSAFWLTCDGVRKAGDQGKDGSEIELTVSVTP